jgi:hypothetical protein
MAGLVFSVSMGTGAKDGVSWFTAGATVDSSGLISKGAATSFWDSSLTMADEASSVSIGSTGVGGVGAEAAVAATAATACKAAIAAAASVSRYQ